MPKEDNIHGEKEKRSHAKLLSFITVVQHWKFKFTWDMNEFKSLQIKNQFLILQTLMYTCSKE